MTIRQQLVAGRSDAQIRSFLVDRYGEFILLKPRFSFGNSPLWLTPFAMVLVGGAVLVVSARRRAIRSAPVAALTAEERARLRELGGAGAD